MLIFGQKSCFLETQTACSTKSKYFLDHHNHLEATALATASEAAQAAHAAASVASMHCSATAELLARLSNTDLAFEWSMLCQDCTDCWSQHGKPNK